MQVIDERYGDGKGSFISTMNSLTYESASMSADRAKKIFGDRLPGAKVFVARSALTLSEAQQTSKMVKKSLYGAFAAEKFVIARSLLRATQDGKCLVPGT